MNYNNDKLIAAAFVKARAAIGATVKEDGTGNYGAYATLAAITKATSKALADNNLAIIQEAALDEHGIVIHTTLLHESGATIEFAPLPMPLTNRTPQAVGSAITYGRRYALSAICGLAPADDDAQAAEDAQKAAKPEKPKPVATAEQLSALDMLGEKFYNGEWQEQRSKLSLAVSKGATDDPAYLLQTEIAKLIVGIEKKMAETVTAK